jgi:hypothetical protein
LLEDVAATRQRALACSPGRVGQLMMKADDTQRAGGRRAEVLGGAVNRAGT